jgi:hypothetical protein
MRRRDSARMLQPAWSSILRKLVTALSHDLEPSTDGRSKATLPLFDLAERYPASYVHKDGLAAVIEFGGGKQSLDVVPGIFVRFNAGRPVFLIPDGKGGWFETSPQAHDRYFQQAHERSGKKLAKVSQLLKWWKHARSSSPPIKSFYVDMVLAASGVCVPAKTYAKCLDDFFRVVEKGRCGGLPDPCGIAGDILATDTEKQRQLLMKAVEYASYHAGAAVAAEARRDFEEANRQWGRVFNGEY